jgi:hypothetical protein|nr:MAG TPA: hypothetical protein [Caudoviricetes sp.]
MEKHSKAVREMYSQPKKKEAHPMLKYIGRHVRCNGKILEIVGYSCDTDNPGMLIVDASQSKGWTTLGFYDTIIKKCERYWYVGISSLID